MTNRVAISGSAGAVILAMTWGGSVYAVDAFDDNSPWMLGDFAGLRQELSSKGIDMGLSYLSEFANNTHGGYDTRNKTVSSDQTIFALNYDLNKTWNVDGMWSVAVTNRNNHTLLGPDRINDPRGPVTNLSQEVWGGGSYTRITHLTYQQNFLDKEFSVRLGRMSPTEEYFPDPHACDFQSLLNCGTVPGINNIWYGWPVAAWGASGTWNINDQWYLKAGVYRQNPMDTEKSRAWSLSFEGAKGEIYPVLLGWKPRWGEKQYAGNYFLSAFYSNVHTGDVYESALGGAQAEHPQQGFKERNNRKAAWFYASQQLSGPGGGSPQGLQAFVNAEINDRETSVIHYAYGAGFYYTGVFDSRPRDVLGGATTVVKINDRWEKNLDINNALQGYDSSSAAFLPPVSQEVTTELYYRFQATPWLYLQPGVQYYHNPGAVTSVPDALVVGLRTNVVF